MKLSDLLQDIYPHLCPQGCAGIEVASVACDSRMVEPGSLFVAVKGHDRDGADFIDEAIAKGACVVAQEGCLDTASTNREVCVLPVPDSKKFLSDVTQRFYDRPSEKLRVIGITGTNGKTTVSYLIESILTCAAKRCAVIGTVSYRIGTQTIEAKNTTPGLVDIQRYLSAMVQGGIEYCVMEVSSHALEQGRVDPIRFHAAVFTNLTGDHLDYHGSMENYFRAKSRLFALLRPEGCAVVNLDNAYGKKIASTITAPVMTYGLTDNADISAHDSTLASTGSTFQLKYKKDAIPVVTHLIGRHNIYNILAAAAACLSCGMSLDDIRRGIDALQCVPGRLQRIDCQREYDIFVDYAHTEDALRNVLSALKDVGTGRIIVVFGCGGDRDKTKRPAMARAASELADFTVVTSDNPRSEDPQRIIDEITAGFTDRNYIVVSDREQAIKHALDEARPGDSVLIAGKGHETYQVFHDKTIHFDDCEVVRKHLRC